VIASEQHRPHLQVVTRESKLGECPADIVEPNAIDLPYRTRRHRILQGPLTDGDLVTRQVIFENQLGGPGQPVLWLERATFI